MKTFRESLNKRLQDDDFKREYMAIQPEMEIIRAMIELRKERNITQQELAERTGINQADISRLENGSRNPSLNMLKKLAAGMGMQLRIEFVPERQKYIAAL